MLIKQIPLNNGELFAISNGNRRYIANFTGNVEIHEDKKLIPILGQIKEGARSIYASFVVSDDIEYKDSQAFGLINNINIFESVGECFGEVIHFYGMEFIDNDPVNNELRFKINDLKLIERLLKGKY